MSGSTVQPKASPTARLTEPLFWVPQSGDIGLGVSILSYDGEVQVGLMTDSRLVPDPQRIIEQALAIARGEAFPDYDGNPLRLTADSLCVHGDNPQSLAVLRRLRAALDSL